MLMGTENTMYKGKILHVYRFNKNHIFENPNSKHTHSINHDRKWENDTFVIVGL
jgi:hypothetical protein